MKKCVFAGTFDPITLGHADVINSCLKMFDEVVVAILINTAKEPKFTVEERLFLLNKLYGDNPRIKILTFEGAVVDLLERENTPFYVRGVRNTIDFEYENQNHYANKKLKPDIISIYLPAEQQNVQISSSLVKNSINFNKEFSFYVPEKIYQDIKDIMENKNV